jgi:hypothetical protein
MIPALERIGRGQAPYADGVSYDDFDAWNARFVEARHGVKVADVRAELAASPLRAHPRVYLYKPPVP